jgi:hypothetical protein
VSRKGQTNAALLAGLHTRPPIDVGCTPGVDEGATRRVALHRGASQRTKAGRGKRDVADDHSSTGDPARDPPSRCEDSRVRECDLIMRCVASPPRCPSDRHRPSRLPVQPRAKASGRSDLKGFTRLPNGSSSRDAKGEGTPGRGSSVSFTRCEVNRSWLDDSTRSLYRQRGALRATGVSDVARATLDDSAGR